MKLFSTIFRVFLPFGAGYFLSYLYRVVNAVIAPDLIAEIGVGPSALGMLTAVYFITFASFQLPLGILLDRYGPRKVEAFLLLFAGLGSFVFAQAENLTHLILGRALIGFGVSACLMAAFKAYTLWFKRENWPLINGFQMAAGGLGALAATTPVEAALQISDWRGVFNGLALLTLATAITVFLLVPEKPIVRQGETLRAQLRGIATIFTSRDFWKIAPLTTMSQATFFAIQGLWAGPYLTHVAQLQRTEVAQILFAVALAMICGFISLGAVTSRLAKGSSRIADIAVTGMALFMVCQLLLIILPIENHLIIWLPFGFFGTSGILAYSALSQAFPAALSGRVTTAINLLVFVGAFVCQWLVGLIIELSTPNNSDILASKGFIGGFSLLLFLEFLCLLFYIAMRRKQIDDH